MLILSNYTAAFLGNRQLAKNNTEEIFENRDLILSKKESGNDVEKNFINGQRNKASIDHLRHNSDINSGVLEISKEMSKINMKLISINRKIMSLNQTVVSFNRDQIEVNKNLLCGDLDSSKATPENNSKLIKDNKS